MAFNFINEQLAQRQADALYRSCSVVSGQQGRFIRVAEREFLNFSSNDYLGLASDKKLIAAWQTGAQRYGVGSGGSYLVTGYNQAHQDLSAQLCEWLDVPAVALFNSGYSANQAIVKLLLQKNDRLLQDKLNHASLIEAGMLAPCKMQRFKHNDPAHLKQLLVQSCYDNQLVISEGVFSMDGDQAPVFEILKQSTEHDAWLMVDDAHGLGVLGQQGRGSVDAAGLTNRDVNIYMATFGKALGVGGAFIAGSQQLIEYINNFSRPYIYSTGLPPAMAYCIKKAAQMAQQEQWRRDKLQALIHYFKVQCAGLGLRCENSETAIQPIIIGDSQKAMQVAEKLKQCGLWVTAIRPPTVPNNSARLRITLTAAHEAQDIQLLLTSLSRIVNE